MESIEEKVALVTGGARGIGFAMVKELLKSGAKGVTIVDIIEEAGNDAIKELRATFGTNKAIFIKTDVTIVEELKEAFEETIRTFNQLDIVVNNAGILNENNWKKMIAINFSSVIEGTYLAMHKYLPLYKSGEEGVIVNIASTSGINAGKPNPVYSGTKHAVVGLGIALGAEEYHEKYKVRILTICPGGVRTNIGREREDYSSLFPRLVEERRAAMTRVQAPEVLGTALIEVIRNGKSGSVWVSEENIPVYEVVKPDRKSMKI